MSIQSAYNQWSASYDTDRNLTRDLDQRVTQEVLADLHFNSILELGCGTGKNTVFYAQIGEKVHAVDFSEGMIEKAKAKINMQNVSFSSMDITQTWMFDDHSFDLIVCNLVLEHMEDLSFVFSEVARVLQSPGRFFVNELHPFKQYEGKRARFDKGGETVEVEAFVHHASEYVNAALVNGLKLVQLDECWHEADQNKPPRIISFMFVKLD